MKKNNNLMDYITKFVDNLYKPYITKARFSGYDSANYYLDPEK